VVWEARIFGNGSSDAPAMTQRQRKLIGTGLTLASVVIYAGVAVWIYDRLLMGQPAVVLLLFFAVAGIGWVLPAMAIIRWMARP
jgi:hypothetical protein